MARIHELSSIPSMVAPEKHEAEEMLARATHMPSATRHNDLVKGDHGGGKKLKENSWGEPVKTSRKSMIKAQQGVLCTRGSGSWDKNWESINKTRAHLNEANKKKQLNVIRRRRSIVGGQIAASTRGSIQTTQRDSVESQKLPEDLGVCEITEKTLHQSIMSSGSKDKRRTSRNSLSVAEELRQQEVMAAQAMRRKSITYGNNALKSTSLEKQLRDLNTEVVQEFVDTIGCDRATLMFIDRAAQELFFFDGKAHITLPITKGIAGHVAATGEKVIANDPYSDKRFNRKVDEDTGFVTRNILCEPVKSRCGGAVLAILQMINKRDGQDFTEQDVNVMEMCVLKVAQALESKFSALLSLKKEWARTKGTGGRRKSLHGGSNGVNERRGSRAGEQALYEDPATELNESTKLQAEQVQGFQFREVREGQQITSRRGSGSSLEEAKKLRRRKEYGNEVRDSSIGLL